LGNAAAAKLFGAFEKPGSLAGFWAPENPQTAAQFTAGLEKNATPGVALKLRGPDNLVSSFYVSACPFQSGGTALFILQLFPESADPRTQASEASLIQKQKLDCALQLARTVSLDFNNALTSILGHTSHVLSQMEPNHAWRASL